MAQQPTKGTGLVRPGGAIDPDKARSEIQSLFSFPGKASAAQKEEKSSIQEPVAESPASPDVAVLEKPEGEQAPVGRHEMSAPADDVPMTMMSEGTLLEIQTDKVVPSPYQPRTRFNEESLIALAENIQEVGGLVEPIKVRPLPGNFYELIAGERRWRAAKINGSKTITAWVKPMSDETAFKEVCAENLNREDLAYFEVARMLKRLQDDGVATSQRAIAALVGRSLADVNRYLAAFKLPERAISYLEADPDLIGTRHIGDLLKYVETGHGELVTEALGSVAKGKLNTATMIAWIEKHANPRSQNHTTMQFWMSGKPLGEMVVRDNKVSLKISDPDKLEAILDAVQNALAGMGATHGPDSK